MHELDDEHEYSWDLKEGGVGRHASPPVEFEYPTCFERGESLMSIMASITGSELDGRMMP